MADTCWNGAISLLSALGIMRKSSDTQLSSSLPWLSTGDRSRPRSDFMSACANCLEAGNSMKRRIQAGIARSAPKKQAAGAG